MKVLITPGLTLPEVSAEDIGRIRRAGGGESCQVIVADPADVLQHAPGVDVVLGVAPRRFFLAAPNLKWVHAIASGVDAYLYDEFTASPVLLTSEKGLVGDHLADHAFGLLLSLTRQIGTALRLGADAWNHRPEMRRQEIELSGLTMGIFGFGGTGRAMARRAAAFGMTVQAVDRDPVPASPEVAEVQGPDFFTELLATSDVLAVCVPLTAETRGRFDARAFAAMKPGAWLVNVTRGEVMVEDALLGALEAGRLRGAALDVAPREPLPAESPLWSLPNVAMTPHTAGASQYRARRNLDRFVRNLERLRRGEPLEGLVDKELGY